MKKKNKTALILLRHSSPDSDSVPASVRTVPGADLKRYPTPEDIIDSAGSPEILIVYPDDYDMTPLNNYLKKTSGTRGGLASSDFDERVYEGIKKEEFVLYYQPIIETSSGRLFGFESLIRWNHPERGLLTPEGFIPEAEKTGAIIKLGEWITETAMKQSAEWAALFPNHSLRIGINLSAKQFIDSSLSKSILKLSEKYGIIKENIAFEITESAFMEDMDKANIILLTLRAFNYPIYLDDFGTGFASLSYLLHFPVDTIKIDRSFVEWMHIDEQSAEIVRSVATLAHNLKMKVVAEGIETSDHLELAREFGCDYSQGYFFSRPLSPQDAEEFIKSSM